VATRALLSGLFLNLGLIDSTPRDSIRFDNNMMFGDINMWLRGSPGFLNLSCEERERFDSERFDSLITAPIFT
jgi:hypothetical protein